MAIPRIKEDTGPVGLVKIDSGMNDAAGKARNQAHSTLADIDKEAVQLRKDIDAGAQTSTAHLIIQSKVSDTVKYDRLVVYRAVRMRMLMHACAADCVCARVYTCAWLRKCVCVSMCVYMHIYNMYVRIYACMYAFVRMCVCDCRLTGTGWMVARLLFLSSFFYDNISCLCVRMAMCHPSAVDTPNWRGVDSEVISHSSFF
jgi:hypothetical protein